MKLEEKIVLFFCIGMQIGIELWEDDGYLFMSDDYRHKLAKKLIPIVCDSIKQAVERIKNPYSLFIFPKTDSPEIAFNIAIQAVLNKIDGVGGEG